VDSGQIAIDVLDLIAVVIVLPEIAGADRLVRVRDAIAANGDRPANAVRRASRTLMAPSSLLAGAYFLMWVFDPGALFELSIQSPLEAAFPDSQSGPAMASCSW